MIIEERFIIKRGQAIYRMDRKNVEGMPWKCGMCDKSRRRHDKMILKNKL
jgi:hypothetical protein